MVIIVKYGEIALKGNNRGMFEKRLIKNIHDCLRKNKVEYKGIKRLNGRLIIETDDTCDCLSYVFGISSYSHAKEVSLDMLKEKSLEEYSKGTFRVSVKRVDKILKPSPEIEREIGAYIVNQTGAKVKLKDADIEIHIEIFKDRALVYSKKNKGPGGLPVGIEGKVCVLLEDKDSVKAAKLMMKRGCEIVLLKVNDIDISELKRYEYGFKLRFVDNVPGYVLAVVTSEKINNLKDRSFNKPILRPLIAF
jgi:thiamine biosynthesis protein ThiI